MARTQSGAARLWQMLLVTAICSVTLEALAQDCTFPGEPAGDPAPDEGALSFGELAVEDRDLRKPRR